MVTCTTTGNLRDCFVKRPRPACTTIMDRGFAMIPLPRWGRTEDWRVHKKKIQSGIGPQAGDKLPQNDRTKLSLQSFDHFVVGDPVPAECTYALQLIVAALPLVHTQQSSQSALPTSEPKFHSSKTEPMNMV